MDSQEIPSSFKRMAPSVPPKQHDLEEGQQKTHEKRYNIKHLTVFSIAAVLTVGVFLFIIIFPLRHSTPLSTSHCSGHQNASSNVSQGKLSWTEEPFDKEAQSYYELMMNRVEEAMNRSVDPCDDFYQYACGRWSIHNQPLHGALHWTNFEEMTIRLWKKLAVKLETLANYSSPTQSSQNNHSSLHNTFQPHDALSSIRELISEYYKSCEDEELLTLSGMDPLKKLLSEMDKLYLVVSEKFEPLQAFQKILEFVHHDLSLHVLFRWKVETDNTLTDSMIIELDVPKTHLIQQGMEFRDKEKLINTYSEYAKALVNMAGTFNNNSLDKEVNTILELLNIFLPINGSYILNRPTIADLGQIAPMIDWHEYFNTAFNRVGTHITTEEVVLSQIDEYLSILSKHILSEISTWGLDRLYVYLRWEVIHHYSQFLHKPARNTILPLIHEITNVNVSAIPNFRVRPCVKDVVKSLPLTVSHLLIEIFKEDLPEKATINDNIKTIMKMAKNIQMEYLNYIESFTWLKADAKRVLLDKLINADIKIGYPSIADNPFELQEYYKELKLTGNYFTNQLAVLKFNKDNLMRLLRQPHLFTEWQAVSPMSVVTFYMYRRNVLLIPLGGLLHPVYSPSLPVYMAYAALGSLISHELGHSVDIVGRSRDIYGRINDTLWDEDTINTFVEQVDCRAYQYDKEYYPIQDILTIAEVMADDGSVGTAFMAASHHFQDINLPSTIMNSLATLNLSPQQFFFVYYAQMFCSSSESEGVFLGTMKHYPSNWARVTATLANTPQFHALFQCHQGSTMNPATEQCQIW